MKCIAAALFVLMSVSCVPIKIHTEIHGANEYATPDEIEEIAGATVWLQCRDAAAENEWSGSGVVIFQNSEKAYIVTAAHVTDEASFIGVWQFSGSTPIISGGMLVYTNPKTDIALVVTRPVWKTVAPVINEIEIASMRRYSRAIVCGHPSRVTEPHVTEGRICDLNDHNLMRVSASVWFGNSGGGIWVKAGDKWKLCSLALQVVPSHRGITPDLGLGCLPSQLLEALTFVRP